MLLFTDVSPTSVNVTWPAWDHDIDLGSGPVVGYQIDIKEAEENEFRNISVGMSRSYLFENLIENTEYSFRVIIFRDHETHGQGPPSNEQKHTIVPRRKYYFSNDTLKIMYI